MKTNLAYTLSIVFVVLFIFGIHTFFSSFEKSMAYIDVNRIIKDYANSLI